LLYALAVASWSPLAVIAALVTMIILSQKVMEQRRTQALTEVALRLGFTFGGEEWQRSSHTPQLETSLFEGKSNEKVRNIMSGDGAGLEISLFDYSYRSGKHAVGRTLATFSQDIWLPNFEVAPQDTLHMLSDALFHRAIRFESHSNFSKRFRLVSVDEQKTRELFTPGILSFLESFDAESKCRIEGSGRTLVIYCRAKKGKAEEIPAFLADTTGIAGTFLRLSGLHKPTALPS
jgi:hypothetical protein